MADKVPLQLERKLFFSTFFKFGEDDFLMIAMLMMSFDSHGDAGTSHEVEMCPLYSVVT